MQCHCLDVFHRTVDLDAQSTFNASLLGCFKKPFVGMAELKEVELWMLSSDMNIVCPGPLTCEETPPHALVTIAALSMCATLPSQPVSLNR